MLYVGYVLEKRLDVNPIIDNVMTSDLIRMCVFGSALYHCHNWRERFVPLYRMHRLCLENGIDSFPVNSHCMTFYNIYQS